MIVDQNAIGASPRMGTRVTVDTRRGYGFRRKFLTTRSVWVTQQRLRGLCFDQSVPR
jgi:hypothetical protein